VHIRVKFNIKFAFLKRVWLREEESTWLQIRLWLANVVKLISVVLLIQFHLLLPATLKIRNMPSCSKLLRRSLV